MTISQPSPKFFILLVLTVGLAAMGQGCRVNVGSSPTLDGGVWRSDDNGQTWKQKTFIRRENNRTVSISDVTGRFIWFHPDQPDTVFLGTRENGIWYTTDAGERWRSTSIRTGNYECLDADPLNRDVMYTSSGAYIWKSIDGGQQWTRTYTESQPGHGVQCVAVDPDNGAKVWGITTGGKLILSEDYGQTWTLRANLRSLSVRKFYIDPENSSRLLLFTKAQGIMVIEDKGAKVTNLKDALKPFKKAEHIHDVEIVTGPVPAWYLATDYGLMRSNDQGVAWTVVPTLITPRSVAIQNVAVNPRNSQDILLTTGQKLHRSLDGGATWTVTTLPSKRLPVLLSFDPRNPLRLYVGTYKPLKQ